MELFFCLLKNLVLSIFGETVSTIVITWGVIGEHMKTGIFVVRDGCEKLNGEDLKISSDAF